MTQASLFKLALRILGPKLGPLGFQYERGVFYRELPSGVMHIILLDTSRWSNENFDVTCGLSSRLISPAKEVVNMGFVDGNHLTARGWDCNSAHWPCSDESAAIDSLAKIASQIDSLIEPWFQARTSLSSIAKAMNNEQHGIYQAKLFVADGKLDQARGALLDYRNRLQRPKPWDEPDWLDGEKKQVEDLLHQIEKNGK